MRGAVSDGRPYRDPVVPAMAPFLRAVSLRQTRMGGTVWPEEGADGWNGEKPQSTITHNLSVPIVDRYMKRHSLFRAGKFLTESWPSAFPVFTRKLRNNSKENAT